MRLRSLALHFVSRSLADRPAHTVFRTRPTLSDGNGTSPYGEKSPDNRFHRRTIPQTQPNASDISTIPSIAALKHLPSTKWTKRPLVFFLLLLFRTYLRIRRRVFPSREREKLATCRKSLIWRIWRRRRVNAGLTTEIRSAWLRNVYLFVAAVIRNAAE